MPGFWLNIYERFVWLFYVSSTFSGIWPMAPCSWAGGSPYPPWRHSGITGNDAFWLYASRYCLQKIALKRRALAWTRKKIARSEYICVCSKSTAAKQHHEDLGFFIIMIAGVCLCYSLFLFVSSHLLLSFDTQEIWHIMVPMLLRQSQHWSLSSYPLGDTRKFVLGLLWLNSHPSTLVFLTARCMYLRRKLSIST